MSKKERIRQLIEEWGGRFSVELGIDLGSRRREEVFKWFLASILFGTRIRQDVARQTYLEFEKHNVATPEQILEAGWEGLVRILDEGGYALYDFSTATRLLELAGMLKARYNGDLNQLHEAATDLQDLEARLLEFKGVGPVTVNIFLRELRGVWEKADPLPGDLVITAARELGFTGLTGKRPEDRKQIQKQLERAWRQADLSCLFSDFEAALVKYGIAMRRKQRKQQLKTF